MPLFKQTPADPEQSQAAVQENLAPRATAQDYPGQALLLNELSKTLELDQLLPYAQQFTLNWPEAQLGWLVLAEGYRRKGDYEAAAYPARRLAELFPDESWTHRLRGDCARRLGWIEEAERYFQQALTIDKKDHESAFELAVILCARDQLAAAEKLARQALAAAAGAASDQQARCWLQLGKIQAQRWQLAEAEKNDLQALTLLTESSPLKADVQTELGEIYIRRGDVSEAEFYFRLALRTQPDHAQAHQRLLWLLAKNDNAPSFYLRQLAQAWAALPPPEEEREELSTLPSFVPSPRTKDQPRVIGVLVPRHDDPRLIHLVEPWLRTLDPQRDQLLGFYNDLRQPTADDLTQRPISRWLSLFGMPNPQAVKKLRASALDVLIDLGGHSIHSRLKLLTWRVAPLQYHLLADLGTTGVRAIDGLIADAILVPPAEDVAYSERVVRLDRPPLVYAPLTEVPLLEPRPTDDGLWLGSLVDPEQITAKTLALWAEVLRAQPQTRLRLQLRAAEDHSSPKRIHEICQKHGIAAERVEFFDPPSSWQEHMLRYQALDIVLDTYPAHDPLTACEALWMGLPLVTRAGESLVSRGSSSVLQTLGRPEWIAASAADLVKIVATIADDPAQRAQLRAEQRGQFTASPLGDAAGLAQSMIALFEGWHKLKNNT